MSNQDVIRSNAVELGWHIGYYHFILMTIGKNVTDELTDEERQIVAVIKDRFENLLAFFELDEQVRFPTSPVEARALEQEFENDDAFNIASNFQDALRIRKGAETAQLLTLGHKLMAYGLVGQRTEPEVQATVADLKATITDLATSTNIPNGCVDELLREPGRLIDLPWVLKVLFQSAPPPLEKSSNRGRVFLCHASEDKLAVSELYDRLKQAGHQPWLDKEDLLPGQEWRKEIPRVIRSSACVIVILSIQSVAKRGYVQKEFKLALDVLEELPENQIFLIPILLDDCEVPDLFARFHWIRLDEGNGFDKLLRSIRAAEENYAGNDFG